MPSFSSKKIFKIVFHILEGKLPFCIISKTLFSIYRSTQLTAMGIILFNLLQKIKEIGNLIIHRKILSFYTMLGGEGRHICSKVTCFTYVGVLNEDLGVISVVETLRGGVQ